jgi:DNA-binding protein YbaB
MDLQQGKLSPNSEEYFSSIYRKMKAIGDSLDSRITRWTDENDHVTIAINGRRIIQGMEISALLLDTTDKRDVLDILMKNINAALQKCGRSNLEEVMKAVSLQEYADILARENEKVQSSITQAGQHMSQFTNGLLSVKKKAVSQSGCVEMTMSGANVVLSIAVPDAFLCSKNKAQIENDLIETANELTGKFQKSMTGKLLAGGEEIRNEIQVE